MIVDADRWAARLLDAEARRQEVAPITDTVPGLSVEDGYAIQEALLARRLASGERIVGAKLGLTSRAKQRAMNVDEPCYAVLTDAMYLPAEEPIRLGELIHPRVEPEIVLYLGEDLAGPGVTAQDALDATSAVCCGLEVIDSRYTDFRFSLADVVADNASSARFTLGPRRVDPRLVDLSLVGCLFEHDGNLVATAAGAAVLGHPAEAVARLANWLGRRGQRLRAGWAVLSGGLTDAVPLSPGSHVVATFGHLGRVGLRAVA
jgi:2-oxo-3-hexenedioate decarboxylase